MTKKISQTLCVILCFVFCLALFSGCAELPTLDEQTAQQILQFYAKDVVAPFAINDYRIRNYYGCYNGAHVFILDGYSAHYNYKDAEKLVVGGLTFDITNEQLIKVLYNDTSYSLSQALDANVLSQQDLQNIHKLFGKFGANYINGIRLKTPTLPNTHAIKLDGCIGYFGKYDGVHVYYTRGAGFDIVTATKIGERNVYIDNLFVLMAYVDGQAVPFNQANDKLSQTALEELYNMIMYVGFTY